MIVRPPHPKNRKRFLISLNFERKNLGNLTRSRTQGGGLKSFQHTSQENFLRVEQTLTKLFEKI